MPDPPKSQQDVAPATVGYSEPFHRCERCGRALSKRGARCLVCGIVDGDGPVPAGRGDEGRFSDRVMLAQGTMAAVCRGRDHLLRRDVALKAALADLKNSDTVQRWLRDEAQVLARLKHNNVVQLYHLGQDSDGYFLVLELINGGTLADTMRESGGSRLTVERIVGIMDEVLEGVQAIHEQGVIHGQIMPENVMIEQDTNRPVIIGFSRAQPVGESQPFTGHVSHHTAPELREPKAAISVASDIYSLGRMFLALLAGEELSRPSDTSRGAYTVRLGAFESLIVKSTAIRPELRYSGVAAMRAALRAASERLAATPPARPSPPAEARSAALRIVVADGDDAFQQLARQALRIAFFQKRISIKQLPDSTKLVESTGELPQLLVLDARSAGSDVLQTLTMLRSSAYGALLRAVLVGADIDEPLRERFNRLGIYVVNEPVKLGALVETISAVSEQAGWLSED